MNRFSRLTQRLTHLGNQLLPTQCLLCGCSLYGELICEDCTIDLPWAIRHEYLCAQCALALTSCDSYCGHCLKQPPHFSQSHIPFDYEHPIDTLLHSFKYRRNLSSGKLLAQLLSRHLQDCAEQHPNWVMPDILIPTPMHWLRRWQRGYNQAEILGQYLAKATGIPIETRLITRTRRAPSQKESSRLERKQNLRQAFSISALQASKITGKRIALVDDVVTTTATARSISQLLIKAGAKDVQVWALARTMEK